MIIYFVHAVTQIMRRVNHLVILMKKDNTRRRIMHGAYNGMP